MLENDRGDLERSVEELFWGIRSRRVLRGVISCSEVVGWGLFVDFSVVDRGSLSDADMGGSFNRISVHLLTSDESKAAYCDVKLIP